jgi:hypothetical protein
MGHNISHNLGSQIKPVKHKIETKYNNKYFSLNTFQLLNITNWDWTQVFIRVSDSHKKKRVNHTCTQNKKWTNIQISHK